MLEARAGEEAMELALLKQPDLVLLDLQLAGLDGLNVIQVLRLQNQTRNLPIVIISGWYPVERKNEALAAGCYEYLLKSIDFDVLDATLRRYVPLGANKMSSKAGEQ